MHSRFFRFPSLNTFGEYIFCVGLFLWCWWVFWGYADSFYQSNHIYAKGVCCGFTDGVLDGVYRYHIGDALDFRKGYASAWALYLWKYAQWQPEGLLQISTISVLVSSVLILFFGLYHKKPWMGAVGGGMLPILPIVAYSAVRWDIYALQIPCIVLGLVIAHSSRGFSRLPHCFAYFGLSWFSAFLSYRETDNLLLLLSLLSIAFGYWVQELLCSPSRTNRWKSFLYGVCTCALIVYCVQRYWYFTSPEGLQYYLGEAKIATVSSYERWTGYWGYLYWRGFGSSNGMFLNLSLVYLVISRRIPLGILCALVIPWGCLSWISKYNFYYSSIWWPIVPIIIGWAVQETHRFLRYGAGLVVVWVAISTFQERVADAWLPVDDTYGGFFQTSDGNLSLQPMRDNDTPKVVYAIMSSVEDTACKPDQYIIVDPVVSIDELNVQLVQHMPCVRIKRNVKLSDPRVTQGIVQWFIDSKDQRTEIRRFLQQGQLEKKQEIFVQDRIVLEQWIR